LFCNCFQEVLQTDENWGLVQQVLQSQTRTNIKKLTKTFITLSLSDVASRLESRIMSSD
jgi:COP9 signalosome complex subunit 3